jgi:ubiquinone/menaquinone biosynthesis C-methylase UbiE
MGNEKSEWNTRAADDAYHWVVTSKRGWDKDEYYASGEKHFRELVLPVIEGMNTREMVALDCGCGTGRIARYMKRVFSRVVGTDISDGMVAQGKIDNPDIEFIATNGDDLAPIASESVDFIFSYATLQHVPSQHSVAQLFREFVRVLKPGGVAHFDVRAIPGGAIGKMLWWYAFDRFFVGIMLWHRYIPVPYFRRYDSLFGACFTQRQFRDALLFSGFVISRVERKGAHSWWATVQKSQS